MKIKKHINTMYDLNKQKVAFDASKVTFSKFRGSKKGFLPLVILVIAGVGLGAIGFLAGSSNDNEKDVDVKNYGNSVETVNFNINAIDSLDKDSGLTFLAGPVTIIGDESGKQSSTLTADSTPTQVTANPGETVKIFAEPTGYYGAEVEKSSQSSINAVELEAAKAATPELKVFDLAANAYVGTYNAGTDTLTVPNPALTAVGASKTYRIDAIIDDSNSQFGETGLYLASNAKTSKYDIGSSMSSLGSSGLTSSMVDSDMKNVFQPSQKTINSNSGQVTLGTITVKLKSGQSADVLTLELYDKSKFLSIDGQSIKDGVDKDDLSNSDNGADNAKIVFLNA